MVLTMSRLERRTRGKIWDGRRREDGTSGARCSGWGRKKVKQIPDARIHLGPPSTTASMLLSTCTNQARIRISKLSKHQTGSSALPRLSFPWAVRLRGSSIDSKLPSSFIYLPCLRADGECRFDSTYSTVRDPCLLDRHHDAVIVVCAN